jgi:aspartyl-tRNA(Asn)/glutamyl-tRNA(Gln) amidotransferase subunit A
MSSTDAPIDPVRAVGEALERIAALNPSLNAYIAVFEQEAMAQAQMLADELRRGRSRGPLHGRPVSIKDLIDVEGSVTTAASKVRRGVIAHADAPVVSALRKAGAVILGKCNLHEFALGTTNDESAFGPARNPYDPARSPGGSSGGSAVAVATGMGWASIGTDTGGSIRIPASACGVVGLKPTFGEISTAGVVPLSVSLDHVGPIARNVIDAWTLYAVLTDSPLPPTPLPEDRQQIRLGKLAGYFIEKLDDGVRQQFEEALDLLRTRGTSIVEVELGAGPDIAKTYGNVVLPEAYSYHAETLATHAAQLGEGVRSRLEAGRHISKDEYNGAQRDRTILRDVVDAALTKCDALVLPTLPIPPPRIGESTVVVGSHEELVRSLTLRLTQLFNLTGHPAISLPCGRTGEGLPCGLQLVGRCGGTIELLMIARGVERSLQDRID